MELHCVLIQSHPITHRSFFKFEIKEKEEELVHSKSHFEMRLERPVENFNFPYDDE